MVVVVVVATNFSVSSWQGFKALRPFALRAILAHPCPSLPSLPDPCLSFTITFFRYSVVNGDARSGFGRINGSESQVTKI